MLSLVDIFTVDVQNEVQSDQNHQDPVYTLSKQVQKAVVQEAEYRFRTPVGMSDRAEEYNDAYDTAYQKQDQPFDRLASAKLYLIQFCGLHIRIIDEILNI